jgi:ABC-2 type transport system ATP-binding protein
VIALESVHAREGGVWAKTPSLIKDVTVTWERGVLVVLGTPADGTKALLGVIAGTTRVRAGRALIDGRAPAASRARVAYVPIETSLPDALRVGEVCELAGRIRDEAARTAASRLAVLGLSALANRRVSSLSSGESRAVSLAIALTSNAPVILVDEPLAGLDPSAPARVVEALRARAAAGAAVVVTTASVRDATRLADQLGILTRGVFTHLPPSLAHVGHVGAKLRVVIEANSASEVSPFVAALLGDAAVASVDTAAFAGTRWVRPAVAVVVSGTVLLTLARAVATAAARTGANVLAIESAVMPLDEIRTAIAAPRPGVLPSRSPRAMPPPSAPPDSGPPDSGPPGSVPAGSTPPGGAA